MKIQKELFDKIIERFYDVKSISKTLNEFGVKANTFFAYMIEYPERENDYIRAQAAIAELMVEDILVIADTEDNAQKARNQIDARRWYASKVKPHKFGDRIDINVNQTVDITSALLEAKRRANPTIDVTETIKQIPDNATGSKPVPPENKDAKEKSLDDLLE